MVWLYAGGVSLILPDMRFGTVSLDWVTYVGRVYATVGNLLYHMQHIYTSNSYRNKVVQIANHHQRDSNIPSTKSYAAIPQPNLNDRDTDEAPQYTKGGGYVPLNGTPLQFFYDSESTGGNIHYDHIVEIAAEVIEPENVSITVKSFSELCYTTQPILGMGESYLLYMVVYADRVVELNLGCGVTDNMLVGKREFSAVFPDFLSWIQRCVEEAKAAAGHSFYPGLNLDIPFT